MSLQPPGWQNPRAYPLLISQDVEWGLGKLMSERRISKGKALNLALIKGLQALGYLEEMEKPKHVHVWNRFVPRKGRACVCGEIEPPMPLRDPVVSIGDKNP